MSQPSMSLALPLVGPSCSVRDTMLVIDRCAKGIAIVVDEQQHLLATITDGDIRRAILAGMNLDQPVMQLKNQSGNPRHSPVTAPLGASEAGLLATMNERKIRQIPLLDDDGRVRGLALWHDLMKQRELPVNGVIMAGGYGKRLMPLTEHTPKPMLPVNGHPLMEHMLNKLRQSGIRSVSVTTHYLSDSITQHFKDGAEFGLNLNYVYEEEPMGTAGALAKIPRGTEPLLVINGDILTGVDARAMLDFHREHNANLTVGVRQYDIEVPFGVVETKGVSVLGITEKPVLRHFINAGIYMVDPDLCQLVPPDRHFDMPDLIAAAIAAGRLVICFPVREYWLDIGRVEHYEKARADVAEGIV